ncbi:MAG: carbamoyltransferase HypF [Nocardioides sp.]
MTAPVAGTHVLRRRLVVRGVVQGVGFRPHTLRLADEVGVAGSCHNDAACVVIEAEGTSAQLAEFARRLESEAPPLARILTVEVSDVATRGGTGFVIGASTASTGARTMSAPDTAVCADCLREMHDPADRRFRHPFITCTNCGPRLTITHDLPYDRPVTTMAAFPMCASCAAEYADPRDRRHHAQPIACHDCGPRLSVRTADGTEIASGAEDSIRAVVAALRGGAIVAIKGIGGYHLACDATSCTAATVLRERKQRPDQPFAVMVRDLATAESLVEVGGAGSLLTSPERPIVLLPRRAGAPVADCVAPGLDELGVLLPYAPLHHLLFADLPDGSPGAPESLVMTSGNLSGEPLCFEDADALSRLGRIADVFLTHDREIAVPCEDSVVAWHQGERDGEAVPVRRSRGFAPLPVPLEKQTGVVLAAGAEVKNTFALARDGMSFVSAHVGDLGSLESRTAYGRAVAQLLRFHRSSPDLVVADLHPGYASRAWAATFAADLGVPLHDVQHHHAHLASLAAEHGRLDDRVLGVVFDGTGYGCDATVWGGELLLLGDGGLTAERVGHLGTVRLPGGDAGVRNPVRTAALAMLATGVDLTGTPVADALTHAERTFITGLLDADTGWVATSSVGRLFDVVAALLGVRSRVTYEAQAAIELEAAARRWRDQHSGAVETTALPLPVATGSSGLPVLDPDPLVSALAERVRDGVPIERLAWSFHVALATAAAALASDRAAAHGVRTIGLTGGVFINRVLLGVIRDTLVSDGHEVLTHRLVPANDGGLALGQVAVGVRALSAQDRRRNARS